MIKSDTNTKRGGTATFMRAEVKQLGCLYKEVTIPPSDLNQNREQHFVAAVMVFERNLEWNDEDAVMIKSLVTKKKHQKKGF